LVQAFLKKWWVESDLKEPMEVKEITYTASSASFLGFIPLI
jgi:hypothetical protein